MYGTNNNDDEESPMVEMVETESTKSTTSLANHLVSPTRRLLQRIGLILFLIMIPFVAFFTLPIHKSPYTIITSDKLPDNSRIYLSSSTEGVYLRSTSSGSLEVINGGQPWIHGSTFELHRVTSNHECFRLQSVKNNLWLQLDAKTGVVSADSEQEEKGTAFAAIATTETQTALKLCYDDQWLEITPVSSSVSVERSRTLRVASPLSSTVTATSITAMLFSSPSSTMTIPTNTISLTIIPELRGVNLGGWFIPEVWMNAIFYHGSGLGWSGSLCRMVNNYSHIETEARMLNHLETWFNASDFDAIKAQGFNSVRVPLGYWNIIQADTNRHRYSPANVSTSHAYLTWALEQCRRVNLSVLLDLHGLPGSQNAIDHSGCNDPPYPLWHTPANQQLSLDTIRELMLRFALPFKDIVLGVELANEPSRLYSDTRHDDLLIPFYQQAYTIIREYSSSMIVVINELYEESYPLYAHDLQEPDYYNIIMDYHLYDWQQPYTGESREDHIKDAQGFAQLIQYYRKQHPIIVGEWSMSTGIILEVGQAFVDSCVSSFEDHAIGWYLWNWKINANSSTQFAAWDVQLMSDQHSLDPFQVINHPKTSGDTGSWWWEKIWR